MQPGRKAERQEVMRLSMQGRQYFQAGQYRMAAQMYRRILKINPNNKLAQRALERCQEKIRERRNGE
jgi:cytochrome c-type biogenesis protein CcmH/NrfG